MVKGDVGNKFDRLERYLRQVFILMLKASSVIGWCSEASFLEAKSATDLASIWKPFSDHELNLQVLFIKSFSYARFAWALVLAVMSGYFWLFYLGALLLTFPREIYMVLLIVNYLISINGQSQLESMDKSASPSAIPMMSMLSAMSILHVKDRSYDSCHTLSIGEDFHFSDSEFLFFKGTRWNCTQTFSRGPIETALTINDRDWVKLHSSNFFLVVGIFYDTHDDIQKKIKILKVWV